MTSFPVLPDAFAAGWRDLLAVVSPVECAGCRLPDVVLCVTCLAVLTTGVRHVAARAWPDGPGVWAASAYRGTAARLVVAWKDRGRFDLTPAFGSALAGSLAAAVGPFAAEPFAAEPLPSAAGSSATEVGPFPSTAGSFAAGFGSFASGPSSSVAGSLAAAREGFGSSAAVTGDGHEPLLLVPIPTSAANRRRRGADLVRDLAVAAVRSSSASGAWPGAPPRVVPALRHVRRVRDQSGLGAEARRVNLHGALSVTRRWSDRVNGKRVVLVDDIVTTGATMAEAARALAEAGALPVGACCLCVTIRQQGVFARTPLV